MRTLIFLLMLMPIAQIASSQTTDNGFSTKSIDSLLQVAFKPSEPGITVLIAKKNQVVYEKAFGSANMELDVPMRTDMVFRIGSISKQFTAIGILKLIEQGKLSLQDSLRQYLTDFPSKGYPITIEHLLTHASGLKEYTSIESSVPYIERHDFTPKFIIDYFKNEPLMFKPGTRYAYSNSGYTLLGAIIESITKQSFQDYMRNNVLEQAGLKHTYYATEHNLIPGRVSGYTRDKGFYENAEYQSTSMGFACGDLLSTANDLYKWNSALLSGKIIRKSTLEKAFTPFTLHNGEKTGYGFGWFITTVNGKKCIKHEGQTSGFISLEYYFPDEDTYIVILTNVKSGEDQTDFSDTRFILFQQIIGLSLNQQDYGQTEVKSDDENLQNYTGKYQSATTTKTIEIKRRGNKLYLVDGMDFEMKALSATSFILLNIPLKTTIEFIKNDQGIVTKLVAQQKEKAEWKKIK